MPASITANVTQSVSMQGAPFSSVSTPITGETAPVIETNVASGDTDTMAGIAGFLDTQLKLLYLLSDQTDCDVVFDDGANTCTFNLIAGKPQLWFVGGGANPLTTASVTMTVHNLGTTNGVSNAVATDFHARLVYSA